MEQREIVKFAGNLTGEIQFHIRASKGMDEEGVKIEELFYELRARKLDCFEPCVSTKVCWITRPVGSHGEI